MDINKKLTNHEINQLSKIESKKFLLALLSDWLVIICCLLVSIFTQSYIVYFLLMFVIGSRIHALGLLGHDGTHKLAFKNKSINDFVTNVFCFVPAFMGISQYKNFHMQHHRHLNTIKDPEIEYRKIFNYSWKLPLKIPYLLKIFIVDISGIGIIEPITAIKYMKAAKRYELLLPFAFWSIFIGVFIYIDMTIIPIIYSLSVICFLNFFIHMRGRFEHLKTQTTHRFSAPKIINYFFFPHNTWCHYEHHKYPSIPFSNLPKARILEMKSGSRVLTFKEICSFLYNEHYSPKEFYSSLL
jgi:fatty acid desaturase